VAERENCFAMVNETAGRPSYGSGQECTGAFDAERSR
jgi:hypothetical protein